MRSDTSWYMRKLGDRRLRKLADFCSDYRHKLSEYPIEELRRARPRVFDSVQSDSPIPLTLVQTYRSPSVVRPVCAAVTAWQEMNPEFDYRFFDDEEARAFIEDRFPGDVLDAFDTLVPGAYRADLWRYCYLAAEGGVYADIRMEPLVALRTVIAAADGDAPTFVAARDKPGRRGQRDGYIYNAFMACTRGHPFVVEALERTVRMVQQREYGRDDLDVTGPACLGAAANTVLNRPIDTRFELGDHTDPKAGPFRILEHGDDNYHRNVLSFGSQLLIRTKCIHGRMSNADRGYPQKSYSELWSQKGVFR